MILNVYTVIAIFLAGVGGLMALGALAISVVLAVRSGRATSPDARRILDDRLHLIELMFGVLCVIRILAWPHFYLMLESYVDDLAVFGVMCVFGVTRIQADLVLAGQVLKPVALLGIGFWCLLSYMDRRTTTGTLQRAKINLAVPASVLILAECAVEMAYIFSTKVGQYVTCCTQFLETAAATALSGDRAGPFHAIGLDSTALTVVAYVGLHAGVVAFALFLSRRAGQRDHSPSGIPAVLLVALACISLVVTRWAWVDVLAPIVLQLPYHHCLYELLTDTPMLGAAAVLTLAGHGMLCWGLGLHFFRRHAVGVVSALLTPIYGLSAGAIASEFVIVGIHCL